MGPAVVGTLITTGLAALMAIPLGILAAIYLNEYGRKRRLARFIRFMTDVMTGVPSVVMGVFIYTFWVVSFGQGRSALAASLALACLMLPIVVRSCEEMLRLVPDALREGSSALGARTWKTTARVVLPTALPGIVSGAMLAVARAAGETAPVLFTIGAANTVRQATTVSGPEHHPELPDLQPDHQRREALARDGVGRSPHAHRHRPRPDPRGPHRQRPLHDALSRDP